jgi:prepilin-type N-terminal cleavage/methylation domain-containing protein
MTNRFRTRRAFTLVELLVVILIILLVSAVALPTVLPALSHRQVSEAARILQSALAGAKDAAIHDNAPSGIRLLPDPTLSGIDPATGLLNPALPLAANRIIPIETAPEYTEGLVSVNLTPPVPPINLPYPGGGGGNYPISNNAFPGANVLMIEESLAGPSGPNSPTSWFWNIRVGDKLQINGAGPWYTVVGPMTIAPTNPNSLGQNPELFVNVGPPGTTSPLVRGNFNPEFLFLVNGQDDNNNGWVDEGFDGVDNNGNGVVDEVLYNGVSEWEPETWEGSVFTQGVSNLPYTIQRRPAPVSNARAVALPSNVVIDLTTWNEAYFTALLANGKPYRSERSRIPIGALSPYTGYVDILVYPNGTVVPTTIYSSPSSVGLTGAFLHFWLAERSDVATPTQPTVDTSNPPLLPVPQGLAPLRFNGAELKGEYRVVTLFSRTGQITTNENPPFDAVDFLATGATNGNYNTSFPFLQAQQGVRGGP